MTVEGADEVSLAVDIPSFEIPHAGPSLPCAPTP